MDFAEARGTVAAHLEQLYAEDARSPKVLAYGFDTGDAFAPMVDWDGIMGVYIHLVDKASGELTPLSFPQFVDMPDPEPVGPWPGQETNAALRVVTARTRERITNHPGHANQKSHGRKGGVRDALARARTDDEVSDAAEAEAKRITGRDIRFDFAGSDVEIAKEHAEGILRGLERYPDAPLERVHQGGHRAAEIFGADAVTSGDGKTITFTDRAQADGAQAYRDKLAEFKASGHSTTGSPMGVALHEFGHSVTVRGDAADAVVATTMRLSSSAKQMEHEYVGERVSSYATESAHETAAEAFADVMVNGSSASSASGEIVATIDAAYTGAGGTIRT